MDYVSKRNKRITNRVEVKKSEMEWESDKERLMMQHKMQEIKSNLKSKLWVTKIKKRIKIKMQTKKKKMILKWKMTLMEICIQSSNCKKVKVANKENHKKQTNKWEKQTNSKKKKI